MDTKPTAQKWYSITPLAAAQDSVAPEVEVFVLGNIGDRWDENGVIAADMVKDLSKLEASRITLRINSYGGSVTDGLAIYNALKRHSAPVHAVIEGVALSCASYIAMAADTIEMADNAQMMIHAPWGMTSGNARELREHADMLDRYARSMSAAYASKSGKPSEEIMAILTDGKDHWYSAAEAVSAGFADTVGPANAVSAHLAKSFDTSRFFQTVATATPKKEPHMADPVQAVVPVIPAPFARTKADNAQVVAMFAPFAEVPAVAALQTEVLTDPGLTVDTIRAKLLDTVGAQSKPAAHTPRITTVSDEGDKIRAAATTAILHRAGVVAAKREDMQGNPFAGAKMLDIAKASLARAGVSTDGMIQTAIVNASFTQSGSDFPIILENTMHKSLQAGYATASLTWNQFCATGSVGDFREHKRYRLGSFGNLDTVNELGEFTNKSIPDAERSGITAGTKGNIINLSRQAIINDDLSAFVGLAAMLGKAAARSVEADVYALLALNAGLGPTMGDGNTLFHATHGNIGTGAAISVASIDADRVLMAQQKDVSANDFLDLRPAVLLLPIGLGGTARSINTDQYDPDTPNKLQKSNIARGLYSAIVDSPRLSGTRRYSFASPSDAPVLEVVFLDGNSTPYIETERGFEVDGVRYKIRLDYGVGAIDYRGAVTNAGV